MSTLAYRFGPAPGRDNPWDAEVLQVDPGETALRVPGGDFILHASYERLGPDLMLSGDGQAVLLKDYFMQEGLPDLLTSEGNAVITGTLANRLAGPIAPGQFAQAAANDQQSSAIGEVEDVEGSVTLTRQDGTETQAELG